MVRSADFLHRLIIFAAIVNFALLTCLGVCVFKMERELVEQQNARAIIVQSDNLLRLLYDCGVAIGGFSITKSPVFADRCDDLSKEVPATLSELKTLIGGNQEQQAVFSRVELNSLGQLKVLAETKAVIDSSAVGIAQYRARHMYKNLRGNLDELKTQLSLINKQTAQKEQTPFWLASQTLTKLLLLIAVLFNGSLALFGLRQKTIAKKPSE